MLKNTDKILFTLEIIYLTLCESIVIIGKLWLPIQLI